ncbi:hypothetical protein Tco_1554387 [Tanacetum coccineum]
MANLKFADTHNMVAFLSKPTESEGFEQIVDFLNAHPIKYALTINPTIYISCIEQFWFTVKAKTINGEVQLHAMVDGKKIIVTEASVRRDLQLEDAEGIDCLPNSTIFEELTRMGAKTTAWNEFSSTMASAIICLATNQKFNFSKYIFESMVRNLDNLSGKFLMYPSLEAKQDSGGVPSAKKTMGDTIAQTRFENVSKLSNDSLLTRESSRDEDLGEDASKQGRRINAIDADEDITLVNDDADKEMFDVDALDGEEVIVLGKNENVVEEIVDAAQIFTTATKSRREKLDEANIVGMDIQGKVDADYQTELAEGSSKRAGEKLEQESTKNQKVDEDKDTTKLQSLMEVILEEEEVAINVVPLATKVFSQMLKSFTREDLEDLFKLVKAKYGSTRPVEDLDLVLWNDLKTMFEPHVEDEIWKLQQRYKVLSWNLFDSCGVHCLSLQSGMIYMLVEKGYPLTPPIITDMLNNKLQVEYFSKTAYELLKLLTK